MRSLASRTCIACAEKTGASLRKCARREHSATFAPCADQGAIATIASDHHDVSIDVDIHELEVAARATRPFARAVAADAGMRRSIHRDAVQQTVGCEVHAVEQAACTAVAFRHRHAPVPGARIDAEVEAEKCRFREVAALAAAFRAVATHAPAEDEIAGDGETGVVVGHIEISDEAAQAALALRGIAARATAVGIDREEGKVAVEDLYILHIAAIARIAIAAVSPHACFDHQSMGDDRVVLDDSDQTQ